MPHANPLCPDGFSPALHAALRDSAANRGLHELHAAAAELQEAVADLLLAHKAGECRCVWCLDGRMGGLRDDLAGLLYNLATGTAWIHSALIPTADERAALEALRDGTAPEPTPTIVKGGAP